MRLHLGPGRDSLPDFIGLDVRPGPNVSCQGDCRKLPFADSSFDLIYASHIIEHIPWYETIETLKEWRRVLKPGGSAEIWTINALYVAKQLIRAEQGIWKSPDNWKKHNKGNDPYLWCAGRIFAYSRQNDPADPNWHKALFTPKSLRNDLDRAGFHAVTPLVRPRGKDHGPAGFGLAACNT